MSKNGPDENRECGANRDRTGNLCLARAALSQLSYSPLIKGDFFPSISQRSHDVGLDRLELSTSRLSGVRSNHLSYKPVN